MESKVQNRIFCHPKLSLSAICSLIAQVGLEMIDIVDVTCNQLESFLWCHRIIGRHPINCPTVMN